MQPGLVMHESNSATDLIATSVITMQFSLRYCDYLCIHLQRLIGLISQMNCVTHTVSHVGARRVFARARER